MSDAVAHTLDGCEVQPLGEELSPEREELLVDMDVVRERGLEIINTTAYIAITGEVHIRPTGATQSRAYGLTACPGLHHPSVTLIRTKLLNTPKMLQFNSVVCGFFFFLPEFAVFKACVRLPSLQAPSPSQCTRTFCAQSATDWPKARPALRGGSVCPAPR